MQNINKYFKKSSINFIKFIIYIFGENAQRMKYDLNKNLNLDFWCERVWIIPIALILRDFSLFNFNSLIDMSIQDYINNKNRFIPFYLFLSYTFNARLNLFTQIPDGEPLLTLTNVYDSAGWSEREILDMFGIYFLGNRCMVRLLTDYGFVGSPLRKDFPLTGYLEIFYDEVYKKTIYDFVELMQEYRKFSVSVL